MTETKSKTCQFRSKYDPDYKCPEPPLEDSENGYCIFHEPRGDKDIDSLEVIIKDQKGGRLTITAKDYQELYLRIKKRSEQSEK